MENILKGVLVTEHDACLPDVLNISCRSGVYFRVCQKITKLLISCKEFIVCPVFYSAEYTDISRFNTKLEAINRLNNKRV